MSLKKQISLHGKRAFLTEDDILVGQGGLGVGGDGKPSVIYGGPDTVAIFDDFLATSADGIGDTGHIAAHKSSTYFTVKTADTGADAALLNSTNGVVRLNNSAASVLTTPVASVHALVGHSGSWRARTGPTGRLRMGARIKCQGDGAGAGNNESGGKHENSWNNNGIFVGFADTGVLGTLAHIPYYDTGEATEATDTGSLHVGTAAADSVGFYYGERSDTGWRGIATKTTAGDSGDQELLLTSTNPTLNKWVTLEVEIHSGISDTGGTATFYIDGISKGSITSPVASDANLVPFVGQIVTDTGQATLDVDWIAVSAPRDTGT